VAGAASRGAPPLEIDKNFWYNIVTKVNKKRKKEV